jgi:hypothetical protein
MRKKLWNFLLSALVFSVQLHAQAPATSNSADILLRMEKLKVLGSVLYIAAHPDDENTRTARMVIERQIVSHGIFIDYPW